MTVTDEMFSAARDALWDDHDDSIYLRDALEAAQAVDPVYKAARAVVDAWMADYDDRTEQSEAVGPTILALREVMPVLDNEVGTPEEREAYRRGFADGQALAKDMHLP
jgi:hypothetical protein